MSNTEGSTGEFGRNNVVDLLAYRRRKFCPQPARTALALEGDTAQPATERQPCAACGDPRCGTTRRVNGEYAGREGCGWYTPPLPTMCKLCGASVSMAERIARALMFCDGLLSGSNARKASTLQEQVECSAFGIQVVLEGVCFECEMNRGGGECWRRTQERRSERAADRREAAKRLRKAQERRKARGLKR